MPAISPILLIGAYKHIADKYHRVIKGQVRKYSGLPYTVHTDAVEALVASVEPDNIVARAAAHGHDIYEDVLQDLTVDEFRSRMIEELESLFGGFSLVEQVDGHLDQLIPIIHQINDAIIELSDVYTFEKFPQFNRAKRKELERDRLSKISDAAKTVKLADLIDNGHDIAKNDVNFAVVYLKEKAATLPVLVGGNAQLLAQAQQFLVDFAK